MDHKFLEMLVCPKCLGALAFDEAEYRLICAQDKLVYLIEDKIPILLESMALPLDAEENII